VETARTTVLVLMVKVVQVSEEDEEMTNTMKLGVEIMEVLEVEGTVKIMAQVEEMDLEEPTAEAAGLLMAEEEEEEVEEMANIMEREALAGSEEGVTVVQAAEQMPGETAEGMPIAAERMVVSAQVIVLAIVVILLTLNIS
jgi:hypothetical protein